MICPHVKKIELIVILSSDFTEVASLSIQIENSLKFVTQMRSLNCYLTSKRDIQTGPTRFITRKYPLHSNSKQSPIKFPKNYFLTRFLELINNILFLCLAAAVYGGDSSIRYHGYVDNNIPRNQCNSALNTKV